MANRFRDSFQSPETQQFPFSDIIEQFNVFRSNPLEFLNSRKIKIPDEYANNPESTANYMLKNMPGFQQNRVFQIASMLASLFGFRH